MRLGLPPILSVAALTGTALAFFGWWGVVPLTLAVLLWGAASLVKVPPASISAVFHLALVGLVFFVLLRPAVELAPARSRIIPCVVNIRSIEQALLSYEAQHGCFPPAYIADEEGRPMHSWRVLILPCLEEQQIYEDYDFNEPWDGPNNRKLAARWRTPKVFQCPDNPTEDGTTAYLAVVGPNTMWPGPQSRKMKDITDEFSKTIHLVEAPDAGIHWMEPRDLTLDEFCQRFGPSGEKSRFAAHCDRGRLTYGYGSNVTCVDGRVMFLDMHIPRDAVRAWATVDGGEAIEWDVGYGGKRYWRWELIIPLATAALLALAFLAVWIPLKLRQRREESGNPP